MNDGWGWFLEQVAQDELDEEEEFRERECPGDVCCGENTIGPGEDYCDSCTFYHDHGYCRGEVCEKCYFAIVEDCIPCAWCFEDFDMMENNNESNRNIC